MEEEDIRVLKNRIDQIDLLALILQVNNNNKIYQYYRIRNKKIFIKLYSIIINIYKAILKKKLYNNI